MWQLCDDVRDECLHARMWTCRNLQEASKHSTREGDGLASTRNHTSCSVYKERKGGRLQELVLHMKGGGSISSIEEPWLHSLLSCVTLPSVGLWYRPSLCYIYAQYIFYISATCSELLYALELIIGVYFVMICMLLLVFCQMHFIIYNNFLNLYFIVLCLLLCVGVWSVFRLIHPND